MEKIKLLVLTKSLGFYINFLSFVNPGKASSVAYQLFSQPRMGKLISNSLPPILQEAEQQTFTYQEHQFQTYTWKGNENIVLLVHGWESNASRWEQFIPYLKKTGSTIIALDAPAHGLSSGKEFNVPRYAGFIDVAVQKFHPNTIIGHSIGGAACVFYQSQYPNDKIRKMVLLGAPSDLQTLIHNFSQILSLNSKMTALLENHFVEKFKFRPDEFSGKIFGKKIQIKGLIAHDIDDTVVAFEESEKIASSWKNAIFIQTKGLGHSMHDDKLYQQIIDFLSET
jgi:predicted alpha/beta hydrolase family esterase